MDSYKREEIGAFYIKYMLPDCLQRNCFISGISTEMNSIINKLFSHAKCLTCKTSMDKMMHCGI